MVYLLAEHMITPIGDGVEANVLAICHGETALCLHREVHGEVLQQPVMASLIEDERYEMEGYSRMEAWCIRAARAAMEKSDVDFHSSRCGFILSSTKGDIWCSMADTAARIVKALGICTQPIVVSNACTSGVSAQLTAWRLIEAQVYDMVVVVGADVQREFIVSGFQSFKALSDQPCRPFDVQREGLNAGEAVACMVLGNHPQKLPAWQLMGGGIHNDANHISGPSRTAEGSLRCLQDALRCVDRKDLATISVHGTGTLYNDEMESIALHRAGVEDVPVTALKGYYGHTMGAAGLVETILTLYATEHGQILPSKGYVEQGTTYAVNISACPRATSGRSCVKLLSGFGGVNAAVAWEWTDSVPEKKNVTIDTHEDIWQTIASYRIAAPTDLTPLYREWVGDYPKYFKMDALSRLGFLAVEGLLRQARKTKPDRVLDTEKTCVILANKWASYHTDSAYQTTIANKHNYFPSPALFVYTLPNIMAGEVAIRHRLMGETSCYVLPNKDVLDRIVQATFRQSDVTCAIVGWVEYKDDDNYVAELEMIERQK